MAAVQAAEGSVVGLLKLHNNEVNLLRLQIEREAAARNKLQQHIANVHVQLQVQYPTLRYGRRECMRVGCVASYMTMVANVSVASAGVLRSIIHRQRRC